MSLTEDLLSSLNNDIVWTSPFDVPLLGPIHISKSVVMTWFIMLIIMALALFLTHNMKVRNVSKKQALAEFAVTTAYKFFEGNMGKAGRRYVPYLSTVMLYLAFANLIGMFANPTGIEALALTPPTKDINVTAALAIMSICLIEGSTFRAQGGIGGFLKSFTKPTPVMTPINILELGIRPLSLCMRLFGNVLGSFVIMTLLEYVTKGWVLTMVASMYFDVFDGLLQAYVFVFLTSLFMKEGLEREEEKHQLAAA